MGTVLSFSPRPRKPLYEDINLNNFNYEILNNVKNHNQIKEKNLKKHSIFISALSWKKFNVTSRKKKENNSNINVKYTSNKLPGMFFIQFSLLTYLGLTVADREFSQGGGPRTLILRKN